MAKRESDGHGWPSPRELAVELALLVATGFALAALGPFGSFELGGYGARLAYWLPATFTGYAVFRPIAWVITTAAERLDFPAYPAMLLAILIGAFPGSAAMLWIGGVGAGDRLPVAALGQLYVQVALIGVIVGTFMTLIGRKPAASPAIAEPAAAAAADKAAAAADAPAKPFFDRLPPSWTGRVVALEMEDHYVRVHGSNGHSALLLMRMADAVRELDDADGARVHRSWWVTREAVSGRVRDGRKLKLKLANQLEVPVARDRVAELRANGWPV